MIIYNIAGLYVALYRKNIGTDKIALAYGKTRSEAINKLLLA